MLVLSRREGESLIIGDDIVITVVRSGSSTRLGITAPLDVRIMREELISKETQQSTEEPQEADPCASAPLTD